MTLPDKLNLLGVCVSGGGSTVAMVGAYLQMNGYFAFKRTRLFSELWHILKAFKQGFANGRNRIGVAAKLAENTERRGTSLIGFYCVLLGFFLQMLGAGLMVWALLHAVEPPGRGAPTGG